MALTDAFGLSDFCLNSTVGCYDGDATRRHFAKTKEANPFKPHPYFESTIKPIIMRNPVQKDIVPLNEWENWNEMMICLP